MVVPCGFSVGSTRQIPWLRVFVEGVVIVGSILLAFGLQAWWDGRQERALEHGAPEMNRGPKGPSRQDGTVEPSLIRGRQLEPLEELPYSALSSLLP